MGHAWYLKNHTHTYHMQMFQVIQLHKKDRYYSSCFWCNSVLFIPSVQNIINQEVSKSTCTFIIWNCIAVIKKHLAVCIEKGLMTILFTDVVIKWYVLRYMHYLFKVVFLRFKGVCNILRLAHFLKFKQNQLRSLSAQITNNLKPTHWITENNKFSFELYTDIVIMSDLEQK